MATTTRDVDEHVAEIRARLEKLKAKLADEESRLDELEAPPDVREHVAELRDEVEAIEKEIDDFQADDAR
ncbi:MAG: hypothetical protein H0U00_14665 [Actinobacteria bacterium]|nr:hypothetical protein [Actinomycetota bacterium]